MVNSGLKLLNPSSAKGDYIPFQSVLLKQGKSLLLGMKCVFTHKICECLISNLKEIIMSRSRPSFNPLQVVGRGSETQLQVGYYSNTIT